MPREVYDKLLSDPAKSNYLAGLEVGSLGEPTNSFGPNMWFVPYKIQFNEQDIQPIRSLWQPPLTF